MHLLIPLQTKPDKENIPVALSLNDIEFIQKASDCFMQVMRDHSDIADLELLFKSQYDKIKETCKTAINWAYGFTDRGDSD